MEGNGGEIEGGDERDGGRVRRRKREKRVMVG